MKDEKDLILEKKKVFSIVFRKICVSKNQIELHLKQFNLIK